MFYTQDLLMIEVDFFVHYSQKKKKKKYDFMTKKYIRFNVYYNITFKTDCNFTKLLYAIYN